MNNLIPYLVIPAVAHDGRAAARHVGVVVVELGLDHVIPHHHVGRVVQGQARVGLS